MVLWRIGNYVSLDGIGGLPTAGRWHGKGRPIVYCAQNPSTALLEILVYLEIDSEDRPARFQVLRIEGPETLSIETVGASSLPSGWADTMNDTQAIGDAWLASGTSLLLQVPSALVPETWNLLVNPAHREARLLEIAAVYRHPFDRRLLK